MKVLEYFISDMFSDCESLHDRFGPDGSGYGDSEEHARLNLLQFLIAIQKQYSHISAEAIELLHERLDIPVSQIEGVIDFYTFLHIRFLLNMKKPKKVSQHQYRMMISKIFYGKNPCQ